MIATDRCARSNGLWLMTLWRLVQAFIHCRLNYCNALLVGTANAQIKRLQCRILRFI